MPCVLAGLPKPPAMGSDALYPVAELSSQLHHSTGIVQTLSSASRDMLGKKAAIQIAQTTPSSSVEEMWSAASLLLLPHM